MSPLPYRPEYEQLEDDEAQTAQEMAQVMQRISATVAVDESHAFRSVHARTHGILHGTLEVLALSGECAHGLFARNGTHAVVMRLSSTPGDLLDDMVSTPRGLALKVLEADGPRLEPADGLREQDFLMVNGPVFNAPTANKFLRSLKLLSATTDKAPQAKKLLSGALRALEAMVEKAGGESATLKALGGHPATHPLGETYFTQVPMLLGPYMAKLSLAPVAPELQALKDRRVDFRKAAMRCVMWWADILRCMAAPGNCARSCAWICSACRLRMRRSNGPRNCRPTWQSPASASGRSCHGTRQARLPRTMKWPSAPGADCRRIAP